MRYTSDGLKYLISAKQLIGDRRGISLVEALVGVVILGVALLGLAAAGGVAARQVGLGRTDMQYWIAVQTQMETLLHTDYKNLSGGSGNIRGHDVSWTVSGVDPKRVEMVVDHKNYAGVMVQDTFVMFVRSPGPLN